MFSADTSKFGRRGWFAGAAAALVGVCGPDSVGASPNFQTRSLETAGKHAKRFELLIPAKPTKLLIALHGLGESFEEEAGARAWLDRYGLSSSYDRLLSPPLSRTHKRKDWTDDRLVAVNGSLTEASWAGLAVVCPFTPNFRNVSNRAKALDEYAEWLVESVLPKALAELGEVAPSVGDRSKFAINGCSMGGPLALEVASRHPKVFGSLGVVQAAFGEHRAKSYARLLGKAFEDAGKMDLQLLASEGDAFVTSARALSHELATLEIKHQLLVLPGPHDQQWLREAGTIEMLLFHERGPI
jgi:pimeloyl-ACP methyl ester carboxylesterase